MHRIVVAGLAGLLAVGGIVWLSARGHGPAPAGLELLNVSYDPTRELWRDLNAAFIQSYEQERGARLTIKQSHGGSSTQARAVIDGLEADVVTLALWSDTDAIRQKGLIKADWESRLPHGSLPYFSTIVFVVRKGNPRAIMDWPDLVRPGVAVITPNPKTSGNGKLSFLAAWGSVLKRGGSETEARDYVTRLYQQVPVLDSGARGSTTTFAQKNIGDVHLTWENEGRLEVAESGGQLELIYPSVSIRAEPYVAVVDANVERKGTGAAAEAYLKFLYSDAGQEILARHYYRPINPDVLKNHTDTLPVLELFPVTTIVPGGWAEAQQKFFREDGVFDRIYQPKRN
ncbi:MAG TPA: sulfate ABC transporter substrate-binding protein [Gemmataceae bacterium]|jgi:sulfate transport system substrate-binding protein|nr:sulfate ABC transporter substrate-binding protein [Gemmataceae bacterium]